MVSVTVGPGGVRPGSSNEAQDLFEQKLASLAIIVITTATTTTSIMIATMITITNTTNEIYIQRTVKTNTPGKSTGVSETWLTDTAEFYARNCLAYSRLIQRNTKERANSNRPAGPYEAVCG